MRKTLTAVVTTLLCATMAAAGEPQQDYLDRMAREHDGDRPVPSPFVTEAEAGGGSLRTLEVEYAVIDGRPIQGFLARPASGPIKGALIVIHEWWGLNDNIHVMAERLAAEGWAALAVDLYEGAPVAENRDQARALATAAVANQDNVRDNLRQARAWLSNELGVEKVGVIGWCFGGGWSLQTGLLLGDEIDAVVIYYGRVETEASALAPLTAPVLGIFGELDRGIPVDNVHKFEAALSEAGKKGAIHIFPHADHAFANPSGTRFNAEAATQAWSLTLSFLHSQLD